MQELQKLYADIPVPPNLKDDILTCCRTAVEKPAPFYVRYAKPIALAAVCVAVLVVSLAATGHLFGGSGLPMGVPSESISSVRETFEQESAGNSSAPEGATTTMGTMRTTTLRCATSHKEATTTKGATATTTCPNGTGGDADSCTVHQFFYHAIDGDWEKAIGKDKMDKFFDTYTGKEECNIVTFVNFCGITREQYIDVMGMTDVLDENLIRHHPNCQYTNREFVDAIFGDDPELSERIFSIHIFDGC